MSATGATAMMPTRLVSTTSLWRLPMARGDDRRRRQLQFARRRRGFEMSIAVFLMVLCAAVVHATWNALVKSDEDRLGLIRVMFLTQFVFSLSLVPFVAPPAP